MIPPQNWAIVKADADILLPLRAASILSHLRRLTSLELTLELGNPRTIHGRLYRDLTPIDHPEFAGHYRGSDHAALRNRMAAFAFSEDVGTKLLIMPGSVVAYMETYARLIKHAVALHHCPSRQALEGFAAVSIVFGKIHPFLDGNGHVQRITFQALAEHAGFEMRGWAVHPKPYGTQIDRLMAAGDVPALADALENFVTPG